MHLRLKLATTAFAAGALVATLAPPTTAPPVVVTPSSPSGTTSTTPVAMVSTSSTPTKPRAVRVAVKALAGVKRPKLRRQKPKQTKRWKKRAARAINASLQRQYTPPPDGYIATFGFFSCAWAIARFVAEYGIPIVKVVKVVRTAVKHWGSIRKSLKYAIDGDLERVLGEDGADVFMAFVGAGDLLNDCVMSL